MITGPGKQLVQSTEGCHPIRSLLIPGRSGVFRQPFNTIHSNKLICSSWCHGVADDRRPIVQRNLETSHFRCQVVFRGPFSVMTLARRHRPWGCDGEHVSQRMPTPKMGDLGWRVATGDHHGATLPPIWHIATSANLAQVGL